MQHHTQRLCEAKAVGTNIKFHYECWLSDALHETVGCISCFVVPSMFCVNFVQGFQQWIIQVLHFFQHNMPFNPPDLMEEFDFCCADSVVNVLGYVLLLYGTFKELSFLFGEYLKNNQISVIQPSLFLIFKNPYKNDTEPDLSHDCCNESTWHVIQTSETVLKSP